MKFKNNLLIIIFCSLLFIPETIFASWEIGGAADQLQRTQNTQKEQYLKSQYGISAYYDCYPCTHTDTSNPYTETSCLNQAEYCLELQAIQKERTCSSGYSYVNGRCITNDQKCIYDLGPNWKWSSGTTCVCEDGYIEINGNGKCVTIDQGCKEQYGQGSYYRGLQNGCGCSAGFTWNSPQTSCIAIPSTPIPTPTPVKTNDQICQDSYGLNSIWYGTKNDKGGLTCDCKTGYTWNSPRTGCIAIPPTPIPTPIPTPTPTPASVNAPVSTTVSTATPTPKPIPKLTSKPTLAPVSTPTPSPTPENIVAEEILVESEATKSEEPKADIKIEAPKTQEQPKQKEEGVITKISNFFKNISSRIWGWFK